MSCIKSVAFFSVSLSFSPFESVVKSKFTVHWQNKRMKSLVKHGVVRTQAGHVNKEYWMNKRTMTQKHPLQTTGSSKASVYTPVLMSICLLCFCVQRASQWRGKRVQLPRCWGTRCVVCVETRPQVSTTMYWVVRAARASSGAAWSKEPSTSVRTRAAVRWTCTCAESVSSVGYASVGRLACLSSVSNFSSFPECNWNDSLRSLQ